MKKMMMLLSMMAFLMMSACGQNKGYQCTYQMTMDMPEQIKQMEDGPMKEAIVAQMSQMKMYYTLSYARGRSYFTLDAEQTNNPFAAQSGQTLYADYDKKKSVCQEVFFGHYFLINEDLSNFQWKIGKEQRKIAGRACTKATLEEGEHKVVAWFSAETPIPAGPQGYWGLPGLIVQLEMEGSTFTLTDIKVVDKPKEITAPSKGKKVTREEYNKILGERLQQMGVSKGGGVQVIQMN